MLRALIDVQAPYHAFSAKLYKHAAEPAEPVLRSMTRQLLAVLDDVLH